MGHSLPWGLLVRGRKLETGGIGIREIIPLWSCNGNLRVHKELLGETLTDTTAWPGTRVTICMSYFMIGEPDKEHGTNKNSSTGRIPVKSKSVGDTSPYVLSSQEPSQWNLSWLGDAWATRKNPESEWLARDNLETNLITIKPEIVSHVTEQSS